MSRKSSPWILLLGVILFMPIGLFANNLPIGYIDFISGSAVQGWACDPDQPNASIQVHFYSDYTYPGGTIVGTTTANLSSESAVNNLCGGGTSHRFTHTFSRAYKSKVGPGTHPIYAYAIDTLGGPNPLLQGSPKQMTVSGTKTTLNTGANITTNCRYYTDNNWSVIPGTSQGGCLNGKFWNIRGTNEDSAFGSPYFFLPNDPILVGTSYQANSRPYWSYAFHPKTDGTFQIGWVIDKVNYAQDLDRYSGGFLNDVSFSSYPDIVDNIFLDIRIGLFAAEQVNDSQVGAAKARTTVGLAADWNDSGGQLLQSYLEVNLYKTANFDLCTSTCDPNGVYDRRLYYTSGDIVYYDVSTMHKVAGYPQTSLAPTGTMKEFTLPVSALFQRYQWARPPSSWGGVKIDGVYIGHEIWGRGRLWVEFDNYRVYSFVAD